MALQLAVCAYIPYHLVASHGETHSPGGARCSPLPLCSPPLPCPPVRPAGRPHQVLNVAYLIVAGLCSLMGAAGYYMFGTGSLDVITFNLGGLLAQLCACVILVNPIAKFALTMEPVAAAAQGAVPGGREGLMRVVVRSAVAVAILMAARSLPFLAYVMALVGSFMTISVSVTFPPICHQVLCGATNGPARTAWNGFVAVLGLCLTILGTTASMKSLAAKAASVAAGGA